jgi:hypothetical protein
VRASTKGWLIASAAVVAAIALVSWQERKIAQLRAGVVRAREHATTRAALEQRRDELVRQQVPAEVLENMRADRLAMARLRAELETLGAGADKALTMEKNKPAEVSRTAVGTMKRADEWSNAGRRTPIAALETALWAAVAGEVDAFASLIGFEPGAREKAEAMMLQLPAGTRSRDDSPAKWIAALAAADIPKTGSMRVLGKKQVSEDEVKLQVLFFNDAATAKEKGHFGYRDLSFRRAGESWQLVVPVSAVEKYGATQAK